MGHPRPGLILLAFGLAVGGCSWDLLKTGTDFDGTNVPATSRGNYGGSTGGNSGGTGPVTGGGAIGAIPTEFGCGNPRPGTGVDSDPLTGTNPLDFRLSGNVTVAPVYLDSGHTTFGLDNLHGVLASVVAFDHPAAGGVLMDWTGSTVGMAYRTQAAEAIAETGQDQTERKVRQRVANLPLEAVSSYRTQAATPVQVGSVRTFQFLDFNATDGTTYPVTAEAVYVSPSTGHGAFVVWVDQADKAIFQGAGSKLDALVAEVRDRIYPTDTCAFGVDPTAAEAATMPTDHRPLISDDYLHLVFSHRVDNGTLTTGDGTLGYFTVSDLEPHSTSNQAKILYLASSATSRSLGDLFAVMAHEFQHLLFSCHRIETVGMVNHHKEFGAGTEAWLNEGLSMLAMQLNGYGPEGARPSAAILQQIGGYLNRPSSYAMLDFFSSTGNPTDAYGMVALFWQYLDDRLGDAAMRDFHTFDNTGTMFLANGDPSPTDLADQVLQRHGTTLKQMFSDFSVALALDDFATSSLTPAQLARFQISSVNLRKVYPGMVLRGPAQLSNGAAFSLRPYSVGFISRSTTSGHLDLSLTSAAGYHASLIMTK